MRAAVRIIGLFAILYLSAAGAVWLGFPELIAWNRGNCVGVTSPACSASAWVLSYWWLALLPVLTVATILIDLVIGIRRAAKPKPPGPNS